MSGQVYFTDEDLTAFLDGEAGLETRRAIETALVEDKSLRARLDGLVISVSRIKFAFDALRDPSYPAELEGAPQERRNYLRLLGPVAATALICLTTGWFAARLTGNGKADDWRQSVAVYHALYVSGTLASVNQSPFAAADELARVSSALGKPLAPDFVTAIEKLVYKRAQILGFEGRPLIQLAFQSISGVPVALCIIKGGTSGDSAVVAAERLGMASASWSRGGYDYLLIGGVDAALLSEAAAVFSAKL